MTNNAHRLVTDGYLEDLLRDNHLKLSKEHIELIEGLYDMELEGDICSHAINIINSLIVALAENSITVQFQELTEQRDGVRVDTTFAE